MVQDLSYKKNRRYTRKEAINSISQLAHKENLTELAGELETFFQQDLPLLMSKLTNINLTIN